jgi:hypothetical protein
LNVTLIFYHAKESSLSSLSSAMQYRLRIVCPEGAVVRDGIEIDSCASVGSMEMGDANSWFNHSERWERAIRALMMEVKGHT